jgi:hypothetical protein
MRLKTIQPETQPPLSRHLHSSRLRQFLCCNSEMTLLDELLPQSRLFGSVGLMAAHSWSVSSQRMIRSSQFRRLNDRRLVNLNAPSACRPQSQVRFLGEAAMNRQAKTAESVENDPKQHSGLPNGDRRPNYDYKGKSNTDLKETVVPAEYRECPKQGNLVLFCPNIGLLSLPGAAPAFLSLTAWLECLRDDAWQLP